MVRDDSLFMLCLLASSIPLHMDYTRLFSPRFLWGAVALSQVAGQSAGMAPPTSQLALIFHPIIRFSSSLLPEFVPGVPLPPLSSLYPLFIVGDETVIVLTRPIFTRRFICGHLFFYASFRRWIKIFLSVCLNLVHYCPFFHFQDSVPPFGLFFPSLI